MLNIIKSFPRFQNAQLISSIIKNSQAAKFNQQLTRQIGFQSNDLWKSVLSVSSQGSKKGRGKGKNVGKDLNIGQQIGDGKLQVLWPGLNTNILEQNKKVEMKIIGEDADRETKLKEIRDQMDKSRRKGVAPHERGFTSSTLKGKSIGEPTSYDDVDFTGFDTKIVDVQMVMVNKSILGKKKQASVFVVTGNGDGIFGYGFGKSPGAAGAMRLAKIHASQRLLHVDRYEDRTLFHNFYEEFYFTKVYAEKMPAGYGLNCHRIIKTICQLIGIKDLYAKVEGSRNPKNIAKAFMSGLLNSKKYSDIATEKGLHVVEFKPETKFTPTVLASPADSDNLEEKKLNSMSCDHETDLNLYLFNNKTRMEKKTKKPFYFEYPSYKNYLVRRKKEDLQKKARLVRMRLLDDDVLSKTSFPKKKSAEAKQASMEAEF